MTKGGRSGDDCIGGSDSEGEYATDQSERIGEHAGQHSIPQGPVRGRGFREIHHSFRRVDDGGLHFSSPSLPLRPGILTAICTQDREHTGERPGLSVSRSTADETHCGETSRSANTP
jgi:hypothetical protein